MKLTQKINKITTKKETQENHQLQRNLEEAILN